MSDPKLPSCVEPWWPNKTARDYARECVTTEDSIADAIAAAEERGRRRGVEETVKRAIQLFPDTAHDNNGWIREFITALAPRDSAPAFIEKLPRAADVDHIPDLDAPRDSGDVKHYDCALPEGSDTELPDGDG